MAATTLRSLRFLSWVTKILLHEERIAGLISAGYWQIRCNQMPYLRESRHILAN